MENKEHAIKCASRQHKYSGDIRNREPYASEMRVCDCDGYHTFTELYDHRITLFIALCRYKNLVRSMMIKDGVLINRDNYVWRSKKHSDGELAFGGTWFVLGIGTEKSQQITYHLPIERWGETDFAETLETAPEWDGHTSDDVVERLKLL